MKAKYSTAAISARAGEKVHSVTGYHDGPRSGVADYKGRPHLYEFAWDEYDAEGSDLFLLRPMDEETFRLLAEDWAIWRRWERAFHQGTTSAATHPALPDERVRHEEISTLLQPKLKWALSEPIRVRGRFEVRVPAKIPGVLAELVVLWQAGEG